MAVDNALHKLFGCFLVLAMDQESAPACVAGWQAGKSPVARGLDDEPHVAKTLFADDRCNFCKRDSHLLQLRFLKEAKFLELQDQRVLIAVNFTTGLLHQEVPGNDETDIQPAPVEP